MKAKRPIFSILIPLYNRPQYLTECLESIIENDFRDYEVILSDDCSERIAEIERAVLPFVKEHGNISFIRQESNLGWTENRNFLVNAASGDYVILMGDDDKIFPYTLSRLHSYIETNPGNQLYAFGYSLIDECGVQFDFCASPNAFVISALTHRLARLLFVAGIFPFWIVHPFTMCSETNVAIQIPYQRRGYIGDDLLYLMDCVGHGNNLFVVPEILFQWRKARRSQGQYRNLSSDGMNNLIARRNILSILEKERSYASIALSDFVLSREFRERFLYNSILAQGFARPESLSGLGLDSMWAKEIEEMYSSKFVKITRQRLRLIHLKEFIVLFGLRGLKILSHRLGLRLAYKFH